MRTLEQKISDAGPADQRVDPLVLSRARQELQQSGVVAVEQREGVPWYRLSSTPEQMWGETVAASARHSR